jgi:hypothetical protein
MVFIRPVILRDAEDARFQTNAKYRFIEDLQREMAEDPVRLMRNEDWPQLPPLPEPPADETTTLPNAAPPDGSQPR